MKLLEEKVAELKDVKKVRDCHFYVYKITTSETLIALKLYVPKNSIDKFIGLLLLL